MLVSCVVDTTSGCALCSYLADISKVQDDEVGDGTTSVVVLAGELLREAEKLVALKIHPMTIIAGMQNIFMKCEPCAYIYIFVCV